MTLGLEVQARRRPVLDPGFLPAVLWNRAYQARVRGTDGGVELGIALVREDGTTFAHRTRILPATAAHAALNRTYVERLVKLLLWQKGGCTILVKGPDAVVRMLAATYAEKGRRAFDRDLVGRRMFGRPIEVRAVRGKLPPARERQQPLGRHLDGCRIGFDLGGSDRKCAAVVDGQVVFSDEVVWNPYFEKDPWYHFQGIHDTLKRAAAHLPRIDAIGGSAAGVYVNSEPRVGSLYRGIAEPDFDRHIRGIFRALQSWWGGVPFEVVNDGEVTALAGSMSMKANAVLGYSMGTSVAAGYVTPEGNITPWLNELAFVPVDYRHDAPADEWSGDVGCGVQYFSQQAVNRLLPAAGIGVPAEMPIAERLVEVQKLMAQGDPRARKIYETIGTCFGYAVAHYADFYDVQNMLVLGRVTSGEGGEVILAEARQVLRDEFPALAERIRLRTPDEKDKRHGQAIAAASLPVVPRPPAKAARAGKKEKVSR
ncbi:MAG TPA: ROK family protein [Vicinamibacteria bacterium]